ncbi:hypothetical protein JCM10450v2_002172 [Rhodotorula kratochvilovae]
MGLYRPAPCPHPLLPSLPHELLLLIFTLALPSSAPSAAQSWSAFPARAAYLRGVCTLSRAWRAWAQRLLWRDVVLADEEAVRLFTGSAAGAVARREGYRTETLRLGGTEQGRRMDGAGLGGVLAALKGDEVREVWVVTAKGVDLRVLSGLDNLRTLICIDVQLAPPPPHTAHQVLPPSLPRLETLVLKAIEFAPMLRTISFEDHEFPALETLYFDSHEVLTQVFDGNPHAMPRLRALSPAGDIPSAYLEALHAPSADSSEGASSRSAGASDGGGSEVYAPEEPGQLRLLNITPDFLRHLPHFAPFLPCGISHLRLDLALDGALGEEDLRPLSENADFGALFDPAAPPVVSYAYPPPSPSSASAFLPPSFLFPSVCGNKGAPAGTAPPAFSPDSFDPPADARIAPQDQLVPWGFLREAARAIAAERACAQEDVEEVHLRDQ